MTDQERKAMEMALDALEDSMYPQKKQFDAIVGLKQALAQPEQEPDCGIDRGAWSDVPDATKWVDELRGDDDTEQEPVAWLEYGGWGDLFVSRERKGSFPVYKAPPSKPEQGCCECGVTVSEGYALYCVKCVEPLFAKEWVSLTDEEIHNSYMFWIVDQQDLIGFGKSLETKIKRKNI